MKFVKEFHNTTKYVDGVFAISSAARKDFDHSKINASIGSLYGEDELLVAYKSVFDNEKKLTDRQRASYAGGSEGNASYNEELIKYVLEGNITNNVGSIATPGGTGALFLAMDMCLNPGDTVIMPEVAWGNYKVMAEDSRLNRVTYDIYDIDDMFEKIDACEGKIFLLINSPCGNPSGLSYTLDEWKRIMDKLNNLGKEVVLLNDIAYIDYARKKDAKEYMKLFNEVSDNVLVLIAYSCSKAFSYYGERLGALFCIHNDKELLDHFMNIATRKCRATWSNVNNGAMINIADLLENHKREYLAEKREYTAILSQRARLFTREADRLGVPYYPFTEGFFVSVKCNSDEERDTLHKKLLDDHIYTIKTVRGIRIAICSVPIDMIEELVQRIKKAM